MKKKTFRDIQTQTNINYKKIQKQGVIFVKNYITHMREVLNVNLVLTIK